ncbi:MAG: hypothetical protein HRU29_11685 [Rhizobiales bacterium]|nr:hypothetical protein [Hyphomicrobiales bacterium]NRB15051.1 hypothetical protein [Hyphomicrobiales bacterium]
MAYVALIRENMVVRTWINSTKARVLKTSKFNEDELFESEEEVKSGMQYEDGEFTTIVREPIEPNEQEVTDADRRQKLAATDWRMRRGIEQILRKMPEFQPLYIEMDERQGWRDEVSDD